MNYYRNEKNLQDGQIFYRNGTIVVYNAKHKKRKPKLFWDSKKLGTYVKSKNK